MLYFIYKMQELLNTIYNENTIKYVNTFIVIYLIYQIFNISSKIANYLFYDNKIIVDVMQNNEIYDENNEDEDDNDNEYEDEIIDQDVLEHNKKLLKEDIKTINKYNFDLKKNISGIMLNNTNLFVDKRSNFILKYTINKHIDEYFKTKKFLIKADYDLSI